MADPKCFLARASAQLKQKHYELAIPGRDRAIALDGLGPMGFGPLFSGPGLFPSG